MLRPAWAGSLLSEAERQRLLDRCAREMRRRALLIDPGRVLELVELQLAAHVGAGGGALEEPEASGDEEGRDRRATPRAQARALLDDEGWLAERFASVTEQALALDAARAVDGAAFDDEDYEILTDTFFLEPEEAPMAAHAFHELPFQTRRAMIELLLFKISVEECLSSGFAASDVELGTFARRGLMALMRIDEAMIEEAASVEVSEEGEDDE